MVATPNELTHALEAYRTYDPAGWVAIYRFLPIYAGLALLLIGSVLLAWGSTRATRLLTLPLGAAVGWLGVPLVLALLQVAQPEGPLRFAPPVVFGLVGLLSPAVLFFFAVGIPIGLLTADLLGRGDALVGLGVGFVLSGCAGLVLWRRIAAIVASLLGAWLVMLGLLCALHAVLPFLGALAQRQPAAIIASAAVLAVIGAVYQLSRPSPRRAAQNREAAAAAKQRALERRAVDEKWTGNR